jgi:hypothetical protein
MAGYFLMIYTSRGGDMTIPKCEVPGCCAPAQFTQKNKAGEKRYRKSSWVRKEYDAPNGWVCNTHHFRFLAERKGLTQQEFTHSINLKTAKKYGYSSITEYKNYVMLKLAEENGFTSITEYKNSTHPYRKYRKNFCENIDGRLGFKCTTTAPPQELIEELIESGYYEGHLQVDHIDGDPSNNDPDNLQTLCACCHVFKTAIDKDYLSPGRKELGLNSNGTMMMVKTA